MGVVVVLILALFIAGLAMQTQRIQKLEAENKELKSSNAQVELEHAINFIKYKRMKNEYNKWRSSK